MKQVNQGMKKQVAKFWDTYGIVIVIVIALCIAGTGDVWLLTK